MPSASVNDEGPAAGARPRQDLLELRVVLVQRDVDGIGGDEALNDLGIAEILQQFGHRIDCTLATLTPLSFDMLGSIERRVRDISCSCQ